MRSLSIFALLASLSLPAFSVEYQTVDETAVLYDTPQIKGAKLYVIRRDTPVEIVTATGNLVKVRDADGTLAWIEKKYLSPRRTVIVKAEQAAILQKPEEDAPAIFRAERNVSLDYLESLPGGWIRVRHRDGQEGFVRVSEIWGT